GGRMRGGAAVSAVASAAPVTSTATLFEPTRRSRVVSPLVRRLALDAGFDASHLEATAPDGIVRRGDVEAAIAALPDEPAAAGRSASEVGSATGSHREEPGPPSSATSAPGDATGAPVATPASGTIAARAAESGVTRIPITGMRAAVSEHLSRSRREVPEATIWLEVDATNTVALRQQLREATGGRFTMASIIGRFAVAALRAYPILNARISADGREIARHDAVHLGIAAQTERGLVVPVVHDASALSLRGLRDAIDDIAVNHADGVFPPERLRGGTFTLNNYGGFGVDGSAPILNHPEVAMLGIGRMHDKPWVVDGEIVVRSIVTLTLVFDHRVCDGDVASGFLTTVARSIEQPASAFADL
ncbi:MAG: dihydrolipoamide acetyltransferase family protein, partial [Pseudoclavibacter sp.]